MTTAGEARVMREGMDLAVSAVTALIHGDSGAVGRIADDESDPVAFRATVALAATAIKRLATELGRPAAEVWQEFAGLAAGHDWTTS